MSDVTILKRVILNALALVHEATGEVMDKPGYGWGYYCGAVPWVFLRECLSVGDFSDGVLTLEAWERLEQMHDCTVQYRSYKFVSIRAVDVMSAKGLVTRHVRHAGQGGVFYFPVTFQFNGEEHALSDFIDGNPLPWDRQGEVCTQSAHSTNPVATLENALNQADFKRKEEVMRKLKSFSSALTKSDFVPPWD